MLITVDGEVLENLNMEDIGDLCEFRCFRPYIFIDNYFTSISQ